MPVTKGQIGTSRDGRSQFEVLKVAKNGDVTVSVKRRKIDREGTIEEMWNERTITPADWRFFVAPYELS